MLHFMLYSLYFIQSWFVFVTPLKFLRYKSTIGQKVLFMIIYAVGTILARVICQFLKIPFGIHTFVLFIFGVILFKIILKDFSWRKSIYMFLITFIILLVNDTLIVLPIVKLLGLNVGDIGADNILTVMFVCISPSLLLILAYIVFAVRDFICSRKGLDDTVSEIIESK